MTAIAASKAAASPDHDRDETCKPRANYLKPKEIRQNQSRFDLQQPPNYLKVQED
jgi:hypothetical protein